VLIVAIVVDTSVVIAVAGNEATKPKLIAVTAGEELFSPSTLPWEIGNAVSAMFKQRRISLDEGLGLADQYRQIAINLVEVDLDESIRLAARLNIYAYDAYVIQCAKETGMQILTLDGGLKEAARRAGVQVLEIP
jgi:predicted nucleic acid-binding protein